MKKIVFKGSCVAIVTPFTEDGVNYEKLGELIEFQISEGTDAIVICGTTGEASTMPDDEHKEVIKYCVDKVYGRIPVIAGTGSYDTRHAIELSKFAQDAGADAILTVAPYYNKTSQKGLYEHFKAIAQSISIPVILYNVPSRTNLNINPETVKALSEIENIVGIKECNFNQVAEIMSLCGENIAVYSGEDGLVVPLMSLGGLGVISVMANIIPAKTKEMTHKFLRGDIEGSRKIQIELIDLIKALFSDVSPMPVKAAMNLMGMNVGKCRMPLVEPSEKTIDMLKSTLINHGLIK